MDIEATEQKLTKAVSGLYKARPPASTKSTSDDCIEVPNSDRTRRVSEPQEAAQTLLVHKQEEIVDVVTNDEKNKNFTFESNTIQLEEHEPVEDPVLCPETDTEEPAVFLSAPTALNQV